MKGKDVIEALKKKLGVRTDPDLASKLGISYTSILNWKKRPNVTPLQIANLIPSAVRSATKQLETSAVRPIIEFYSIQRCYSRKGANFELFDTQDEHDRDHPFRSGLKKDLESSNGIYLFFDSRGRAIYAGKAKGQNLWLEMKAAFNRDRGFVQGILRTDHPETRVVYKSSDDVSRQIKRIEVQIHELAAYFSAYKVANGMIDELESLLVRGFANDLLNVRMEKFSGHHRGSS